MTKDRRVSEGCPPERLLETVERFEEDLTDVARIHRPLRVVIRVAPAIEVSPARARGAAEDPLMQEVRESLEALPAQFRAAILLADIEGFSYKEIAEILSVPVGTVMSRLSRGRHLLQRQLWEYAKDRHFVRGD